MVIEYASDPESYTSGNIPTSRASLAGHVRSLPSDEDRRPAGLVALNMQPATCPTSKSVPNAFSYWQSTWEIAWQTDKLQVGLLMNSLHLHIDVLKFMFHREHPVSITNTRGLLEKLSLFIVNIIRNT